MAGKFVKKTKAASGRYVNNVLWNIKRYLPTPSGDHVDGQILLNFKNTREINLKKNM